MREFSLARSPVDLHVHSAYSDGTQSPEEIISTARGLELAAVAITDHDSVNAIRPGLEAASSAGVELVPGVEICAHVDSIEVHMLGYFVDPDDQVLAGKLQRLRGERVERLRKIAGRLNGLGVSIDPEEVLSLAGLGSVGRLHVADYLTRNGVTSSIGQAFEIYIGDGRPAYVPSPRIPAPEAIRLIHAAGGVAVLAHPGVTMHDELIPPLVMEGLDGIEALHPKHHTALVNFYSSLAHKHGLLVTGGSDAHGRRKEFETIGSVTVPYSCVERLRERAGEYR